MALKFDLGEALSQAAHAAGEVAKGASATVESAAKGVANAAEGAGNAIVDAAASASEAVGSAMCSAAEGVSSAGEQIASSDAGKAIAGAANTAGGIAVGAAMGLAQGASSLASGAASTVEGGINAIKENSFSARLRKARIKGFRDGIKQGAYLAGEKRHNFTYAYVATLCFLMRCDGDFSQEEQEWLEDGLDYLNKVSYCVGAMKGSLESTFSPRLCSRCGDRYSRPRTALPLALLIPARRQPTGGPARVP